MASSLSTDTPKCPTAILPTILLVEDSANDVELTLRAFKANQLANDIVVARDGAEALDYLHRKDAYADRTEGNPALVVLDLHMPRVDGLEVLRCIKGDPNLRTIPVVILTSSREDRDLIESYGLGVNAYVIKPVDFSDFIEAVKILGRFWALVEQPPGVTLP
jgi:CheY-like chemotaxis protein